MSENEVDNAFAAIGRGIERRDMRIAELESDVAYLERELDRVMAELVKANGLPI